MFTNKNFAHVVAALVAAGVALVMGVPAYYLLVLACPVMMFFMMSSMSGGNTHNDADTPDAKTSVSATTPDGSHDRI
jgi:type III secretory pathway component EscV